MAWYRECLSAGGVGIGFVVFIHFYLMLMIYRDERRNNAIQGIITVNVTSMLSPVFLELTLNDFYRTSPCSVPNARAYRRGYAKRGAYYELVFMDNFEVNRQMFGRVSTSLSFQFFFLVVFVRFPCYGHLRHHYVDNGALFSTHGMSLVEILDVIALLSFLSRASLLRVWRFRYDAWGS